MDSLDMAPANRRALLSYLVRNFEFQMGNLVLQQDLGYALERFFRNNLNNTFYQYRGVGSNLLMDIAQFIGPQNPRMAERLLEPLIGDGSNPQLHLADSQNMTLAHSIVQWIAWQNPQIARRLLIPLIGDGRNPQLHLRASDRMTLAGSIAKHIGLGNPRLANHLLQLLNATLLKGPLE